MILGLGGQIDRFLICIMYSYYRVEAVSLHDLAHISWLASHIISTIQILPNISYHNSRLGSTKVYDLHYLNGVQIKMYFICPTWARFY